MTIDEVLRYFNGVKHCSEGQYMAKCPCHDDRKASLSIGVGQKGVVLKCQAGCDTRDIIQRVGLDPRDLFYEDKPIQTISTSKPQLIATYSYPNGAQKLRYTDKSFTWRHKDESGKWVYNRHGVKRSLYVAGKLDGMIFVVEGEKDCDNLNKLGFNAVSGEDGAGPGKWRDEYTEQLRDHPVAIIQDNDDVGKAYAKEVAKALYEACPTVWVLDLSEVWPEIPKHGDVSDLIEKFGDERACEMLAEIGNKTTPWETKPAQSVFDTFKFYTVPDLTDEERKPPEFIVSSMIPVGLTFLSGAPKIRKSFMALQMAIAVATGKAFLGHETMQSDVVYLDLEGSKSRISTRTNRMAEKMPRNVFVSNDIEARLADNLVDNLRSLIKERPSIRLIIIDTYSRARGRCKTFGANAYDSDVSLLEPVQRMAIDEGVAIVCVHHDKKGAGFVSDSFERLSGTMGISGSADSVLNLVVDGKRFDGKATLEYTPRDAKGGEMKLTFDEFRGEWQEIISIPKDDVRGNPICNWIITNAPEKKAMGEFFSYESIFKFAYQCQASNPGDKVRSQIEPRRDELFSDYGIGVQIGVKSNGQRGIRVVNLL